MLAISPNLGSRFSLFLQSCALASAAALLSFLAAPAAQSQTPRGDEAIKRATGASLQGDAAQALRVLEEVPASELSATDQAFAARMRERFGKDARRPDAGGSQALDDQILASYRLYWWSSLRDPARR